jgi:3-oxoacyl-[acyl-carrier protein] reductase
MNLNLTGKTALVCGSTQGIGRAVAVELALLGATVVLMARNEATLQQVRNSLPAPVGQAHRYVMADFARPDALRLALTDYLSQFPAPEILVNNTGGPSGGPLLNAGPDEFVSAFHNHLLNNQTLVQLTVPGMTRAGYGRIVNIISTSVKQPIVGLGVSNTIRGAVAQWAKTLSLELGPLGITVNNVLPGYTQTARLDAVVAMRAKAADLPDDDVSARMAREIPIGRFATAEEVAAAVAFLCSLAAASISGINLPVDGGKTGSL